MYCRNCANQVDENAIGCPKCGMDPKKAKSYCPGCGNSTSPEQVQCTTCGVSLASKGDTLDVDALRHFDFATFFAKKGHIAAVVALVGCVLFPWVKSDKSVMGGGDIHLWNMYELGEWVIHESLFVLLLNLIPISLIGFLIAEHVAVLVRYKLWFANGALGLIAIMGIRLHQVTDGEVETVYWGYYLVVIATIGMFVQVRRS